MAITPEIDKWLRESYEYQCFVSWPHTIDPDITNCARAMQTTIRGKLGKSFSKPAVFRDESERIAGDEWEKKIPRALCRSICMVAICAPIYYHPEHPWCGLEWAVMENFSSTRLCGKDFKAILPVMVRMSDPLPRAVSKIDRFDVSRVATMGQRYFSYPEFLATIEKIIARIERIAEELWRGQCRADCEELLIPSESAFSDYHAPTQRYPLVG